MANNRLYIRCKVCKESTLVSKCFGGPYWLDDQAVARVNNFFEDHCWCDINHNAEEYTWGGKFELLDEDDDWDEEEKHPSIDSLIDYGNKLISLHQLYPRELFNIYKQAIKDMQDGISELKPKEGEKMRRTMTMHITLDIYSKDKYEQILRECEQFKHKLMNEMEDYEFTYPERIAIALETSGEEGPFTEKGARLSNERT